MLKSRNLVGMICSLIILSGCFPIAQKNQQQPTATAEITAVTSAQPTQTRSEQATATPQMPNRLPKIEVLRSEYPQIVGYIRYEGAEIDYPVVQGEDNIFYLTHSAKGEEDAKGAIFLDAALPDDMLTPHTLVHGHHMKDGSMFGSLNRLKDLEFLLEHPTIEYSSVYYDLLWEIFAVCIVDETMPIPLSFPEEGSYDAYIDALIDAALYDTGIRPEEGELLLTLNTCSYEYKGAHMIVCARLKEIL